MRFNPFKKEDWVDEIRRLPTSYSVGKAVDWLVSFVWENIKAIFGAAGLGTVLMGWIINSLGGIPTLDNLETSSLTGLGYALVYLALFVVSVLALAVIARIAIWLRHAWLGQPTRGAVLGKPLLKKAQPSTEQPASEKLGLRSVHGVTVESRPRSPFIRDSVIALRSGNHIWFDCDLGNTFELRLQHSGALVSPINLREGQFKIYIHQAGSRPHMLGFSTFFEFAGGEVPPLTRQVGSVDILEVDIIRDGERLRGLARLANPSKGPLHDAR